MKLSIIIPVFNEKENVKNIIERVKDVALPEKMEKEIIIVDDGSTDGTSEILQEYREDEQPDIDDQKPDHKPDAERQVEQALHTAPEAASDIDLLFRDLNRYR